MALRRQCQLLDQSIAHRFIQGFDTVMFDCDGVLWEGSAAISGAAKVVHALCDLGKKVYYVTNNSTKSRTEYAKKCCRLGFPATKDAIVGTAYLTAKYLKEMAFGKKVYLIGSSGLTEEFDEVGIQHFGCGPDPITDDCNVLETNLDDLFLHPEVGAVVVGFDQHISYPKIMKASSYLANPDILFIATNKDEALPIGGKVKPGTGAVVAAVETAAGRAPVVIGKPEPLAFQVIQREHNLDPARTLMVGDNMKTDILLGHNCELQTLLVLTGITGQEQVDSWTKAPPTNGIGLPDFYCKSIGDLLPWLQNLSE